jgi:UDP-N-acetylmuramate dehydrogenase
MRIKENYDLTHNNSYRIKAICKRAYFPGCEFDFIGLYGRASAPKRILLGGGYNIILSKSSYDEDFVIVGDDFSRIQ